MTATTPIRWEQDATGVVTLVLDDPDQSANTMNAAFTDALEATVARLKALDGLRGVIVTSAKKTFFAGGDLRLISAARPEDASGCSTTRCGSSARCAPWRRWAGPLSPRSTVPRSAAASNSRWPATTGSRWTPPAARSACPR